MRDPLHLKDIVDSINKIERYTKKLSFEKFSNDDMAIDAVIRNLEIIGEASKNLSEEFKEKNSIIPWGSIVGMRNKAIHEYFDLDIEILWKTVKEDIPTLKKDLEKIL
ncbi:MAG: DUF86 domain-containing protein [Candidatus Pacebacteria bacterium]|jgi:uncharacterized protein with HEPN domain|nr:DUF86 domain-containing protein [Candidatus Paceibacterota bacterium]